MKRYLSFAAVVFFTLTSASSARACDMCGCAMGGNYMGIFPQFNKNVIGLRHQYRNFNHPNTYLNFNGDSRVLSDEFRSTELWGRFYPHPKVQAFVFLPLRSHTRFESEKETRISGIGDISLTANYALINTGDSLDRDFKHTLLIGGGFKLPTGKYQQRDEDRVLLPAQFQIGTGGYTLLANVNYTLRYRAFGLNTDLSYRHNTANEWEYLFGAQTAAVANFFYWINTPKAAVLPSAGLAWERYQKDTEFDIEKPETGGQVALINIGVDMYFSRFFFQASVQKPIAQDLPFAQPEAGLRANIGLAYTF